MMLSGWKFIFPPVQNSMPWVLKLHDHRARKQISIIWEHSCWFIKKNTSSLIIKCLSCVRLPLCSAHLLYILVAITDTSSSSFSVLHKNEEDQDAQWM